MSSWWHHDPDAFASAPRWAKALHVQLNRMEKNMATDEQVTKLRTDIADLITAATDEITAAVAAAQNKSPDPAIDELDRQVTAETQTLKDAAAALRAGKPVPTP